MHFGIGVIEQFLDAINVIMMAVSQQYVGDVQVILICRSQDLIDLPGRIDYCTATAGDILDQVNEIFHRA
jgi:hypothetical protein